MPPKISSEPYLKRLYNRFNSRYFSGQLPPDTIVRWASPQEMSGQGFNAAPWGIFFPSSDGEPALILLDRNMQKRGWGKLRDLTLLHEMAHVANPKNEHGKKFEKEMRRLAQEGAFEGLW
jgi:hypothetical protein